MNQIEIKKIQKCKNWIDFNWIIDSIRLSQHLSEKKEAILPQIVEPFDDLCPAWTKGLDFFGDVRFVWKLLEQEKIILPIYMCPEDLDFSCIVIVVEVEKSNDVVYWNRVGLVHIKDYNFSVEKSKGILNLDSYTYADWKKYGDNIALSEVDSNEWCSWISDNWDEELFRRRMNYTLPLYMDNKNIIWFAKLDWVFERVQYERMVDDYWEEETIDELTNYNSSGMTLDDCVNLIKKIKRNGFAKLDEHKSIYGEVILHIYASEEIGDPLFDLLQNKSENKYILIYSKVIELMWKYGDEVVRNVVDVTLLERLAEDSYVWNNFGNYISEEFKMHLRM